MILIFIAAAITISDQVSSSVIKSTVMRLRPCHEASIANEIHLVNNYCGGQFGFVSSHAANVFALAAFITRLFSGTQIYLLRIIWVWAFVVSFSRIYLGVHYPGDILGGALLGVSTGFIVDKIYSLYLSGKLKNQN